VAVRAVDAEAILYERQLPASDTVSSNQWSFRLRCSWVSRLLQVVCIALHNSAAVLAHVIESSERTVYLCNWERLAAGERERSLTFQESVLQVRPFADSCCICLSFTLSCEQVALVQNVCTVRLKTVVHIVDLHTIRILQVPSILISVFACFQINILMLAAISFGRRCQLRK
jgi:hypothetical protein